MKAGLFVYGTLHPDRAPSEIRDVVRRLRKIGTGTVRGSVYELGDYPALVPDSRMHVTGTLFELPDDRAALWAMDDYEEYWRDRPHKSLFVRKKRTVTRDDGRKEKHWVYVYNQPIPKNATQRTSSAA